MTSIPINSAASADGPAPVVSVIMNGFNSAKYLREAIDSVLAQTYDDWELVFWDNLSSDDSEAIVRGYADARVHFYCATKPMTLAQSRNAAVSKARGKWLGFLDCDDLWNHDKLARQLARLESDQHAEAVGLIYARTMSFSARGPEGETVYRYTGRKLPEGEIARDLLRAGNLVHIVSALVLRHAYVMVGGIPEHLTFAEDYWLFVAVAEQYRSICVQEVCCHYRVHEMSATHRNKLASHLEALEVLEHWAYLLEPAALRRRRAIYQTLIGLERMRRPGERGSGLIQLLTEGSISFLVAGACRTIFRRFVLRRQPFA